MLEGSEAKRVQSLVEAGIDQTTVLDSEEKLKDFHRKCIAPALEALLWPLASWVLLAPQRRPPDNDQNRPL